MLLCFITNSASQTCRHISTVMRFQNNGRVPGANLLWSALLSSGPDQLHSRECGALPGTLCHHQTDDQRRTQAVLVSGCGPHCYSQYVQFPPPLQRPRCTGRQGLLATGDCRLGSSSDCKGYYAKMRTQADKTRSVKPGAVAVL